MHELRAPRLCCDYLGKPVPEIAQSQNTKLPEASIHANTPTHTYTHTITHRAAARGRNARGAYVASTKRRPPLVQHNFVEAELILTSAPLLHCYHFRAVAALSQSAAVWS